MKTGLDIRKYIELFTWRHGRHVGVHLTTKILITFYCLVHQHGRPVRCLLFILGFEWKRSVVFFELSTYRAHKVIKNVIYKCNIKSKYIITVMITILEKCFWTLASQCIYIVIPVSVNCHVLTLIHLAIIQHCVVCERISVLILIMLVNIMY